MVVPFGWRVYGGASACIVVVDLGVVGMGVVVVVVCMNGCMHVRLKARVPDGWLVVVWPC